QQLLDSATKNGAWGISSGLEYTPGSFATTEEISEVASVLKGTNFPYTTHMRNEGDTLIEAVQEAIQIAKGAGIPLHISHLKVEGQRNWHKADLLFETIAKAEQEGLRITFDRYPYVAYNTGLSNLFPIWAREGGTDKFLERLADKKQLSKIEGYTRDKIIMLGSWDSVLISSIYSDEYKELQGKRLPEIAQLWNCDPFEAAVRLISENRARVGMVGFGMSEENTERILAHPNCVIASDGSALAVTGPLSEGNPHPRSFGTFPRAIAHYVHKRKIVSLPEMIRKMTLKPAEIAGIKNRGKISAGYFADLAIFWPGGIRDLATFENPKQYCQGIEHVFVNGLPVYQQGKFSEHLPGKILKSV
ncbi:amidohydrolase family protein, partial [Calditrichota bacterium]